MKSPLSVFLVVVFAAVLTLWCGGCAAVWKATEPYKGPAYSTPIVTVEERPRWNTETAPRTPYWEIRKVLRFENPTDHPVSFDVICTNNAMHVDVPAKTISRLLIMREDGSCDVKRVR